jgi:membrane fusion protein (multidrug efflux system)
MFRKPLVLFVSGAALAGLAWYGWQAQRHLSTEVAVVQKAGPAAVDQAPKKDGKTEGSAARPDGPQGKGDGPSAKGGPRGPASIEIQAAINKDLADVASAVGTLRANETVVLRSEVAGRIAYLAFKDGETVSKGHTVLKLDAAVQEAELAQAKAELALGQTNFDRSKDLAQRKFVSDSALDQAAANLRVLEAKFQLAKARLDRTVIRAPFSGQLGLRNISLGDFLDGLRKVSLFRCSSTLFPIKHLKHKLKQPIFKSMPTDASCLSGGSWPTRAVV